MLMHGTEIFCKNYQESFIISKSALKLEVRFVHKPSNLLGISFQDSYHTGCPERSDNRHIMYTTLRALLFHYGLRVPKIKLRQYNREKIHVFLYD